jgi:hypothetical protein
LKHIVKKALEPQYAVERADDINRSGTIIAQIVQRVFEADLVVADLTGPNANVFYELAIRHATRKPTVHLAASNEDPPFDVNQISLIKFNLSDPDSIDEAQRRLKEQVKAIEAGAEVTTPVQFAQILHTLESGSSADKQLLEVLRGLAQGIESVQAQVSHVETVLGRAPFGDSMYGLQPSYIYATPTPQAARFLTGIPMLNEPALSLGADTTIRAEGVVALGQPEGDPGKKR